MYDSYVVLIYVVTPKNNKCPIEIVFRAETKMIEFYFLLFFMLLYIYNLVICICSWSLHVLHKIKTIAAYIY